MNNRRLLFSFLLSVVIVSCKKDKEILIEGNTAPPDGTISNVVKENYVNKAYISVLGRKPTPTELSGGQAILSQHNLSVADRNQLLDDILAKPGYNQRLYDIAVANLIDNLDTSLITQYITVFGILLTDTNYQSQWTVIQAEKTKLELLKAAPADLNSGAISIIGLHKRCVSNFFYDQVNMGTENFVVSMFQNFFFRYPTESELSESSTMVDGLSAVIFLQTGTTKENFIDIIFGFGGYPGCNNYFEGQVRDLYLRYLFREPTSVEEANLSATYKANKNYKALQKAILSTDEYAGIK